MKLRPCEIIALILGFLACILAPKIIASPPPAPAKPVVLAGLDPIALVAGRQQAGQPALFSEYGRFRYLFADAANKQRFDAAPASFAVQLDGGCAMGPSMPGDPARFLVHEGRIFLTGSESCFATAKADPGQYLQPRDVEKRRRVAIFIFPGVQIIDYTGPYEVFGEAGYEVFTVAESREPLKTNMGMTVVPEYTFADVPAADVIVVPGGAVELKIERTHPLIRWLLADTTKSAHLLSVCNGAFWLANAGLLDGLQATTVAGALNTLRTEFPKVRVVEDQRFCDNGRIITTAGLSSGIDGSLHVIERLEGRATARAVALSMEYDWRPEAGFARAAFADRFLRAAAGGGRFRLDLPPRTKTKLIERGGDREQWTESYEVEESTLTAETLLAKALVALPKDWTAAEAPAGTGLRRAWKFRDANGADWTSALALEPVGGNAHRFRVTLQIRRADLTKATAAR